MILSLKKVVALGIVVLLSSVAVVWGLKTLTAREVIGPVEAETTYRSTYGSIKLTAILDKSTYRRGESVNVTVRITNIDNKTIVLIFPSPLKVDFEVYNESLQLIHNGFSTTHGTATVLTSVTLEPGESLSQTFTWDQQKMKIVNGYYSGLEPVGPGTYYIFGRAPPGGYMWTSSLELYTRIETPKIEIAIIP